MACPTVTSISINTSTTRGGVVLRVLGTGFRTPFPPPARGRSNPNPPPSMAVLFGSTPARTVLVLSPTELRVAVPAHAAGQVALVLRNLERDGTTVLGEQCTLPAAFTYVRPNLAVTSQTEGTLARVVRAVLQLLKGQLLENTTHQTHTEYADAPDDPLQALAIAAVPGMALLGPELRESRFYATNVPRTEPAASPLDGALQLLPPRTVDLVFSVVLVTEHTQQLLQLLQELVALGQRTPYLDLPVDTTDPTGPAVQYELDVAVFDGAPKVASMANLSNLRHATANLVVRGVDLDPDDAAVGQAWAVSTVSAGVPGDAADYDPDQPNTDPADTDLVFEQL